MEIIQHSRLDPLLFDPLLFQHSKLDPQGLKYGSLKRISAVTRALFKLADVGNKQHIKGGFFDSKEMTGPKG